MSKEIKGSIDYTITISEDGAWEIEYQQGIENEIAALSIAQHVMEGSIATASLQKKEAKGKVKTALSEQIKKFTQTRFGLNMLSNLLCGYYEEYKKKQEQHEKDMLTADVTPGDVKIINAMAKKK